ncbi:MAG: hypothetical protein ACRDT4_08690 [Micromonosporaceae bacterium]
MTTPHHPDDRWFRPDPRTELAAPEFAAPGQRQPASPWADADPLTGPMPPPERELGAPLAEQSEASVSAPPVSEGYAPAVQRQHAERVPRYVSPEQPPAEESPPHQPHVDPASYDRPALEQSAHEPAAAERASFDHASADELVDQMRVNDPTFDPPARQPGPERDEVPVSPGPVPYQPPEQFQPADGFPPPAKQFPPADGFQPTAEQFPPAAEGFQPAPESYPDPGQGPDREIRTSALPTVPPAVPAPVAPGQAYRSGEEPGIPPSLAPMLSDQDQPYRNQTEPIATGGTYGAPQPGPVAPRPAAAGAGNPAVLVAVVLGTLLAAVPAVLLLYSALFDSASISASGTVAGTLMLIGLPMFGVGLYPLISGAASPDGPRGWARTPLAYLLIGLVLLVAAGLAAS